jgi:hypothetical protein
MDLGDFAEVLEAAAVKARELHAAKRAGSRDGTDQTTSGLGQRRHCRIVRHRVEQKLGGAWIVGRRFFLAPAALEEERTKLSKAKPRVPKAEGTAERIERKLGLVGGVR